MLLSRRVLKRPLGAIEALKGTQEAFGPFEVVGRHVEPTAGSS